MKLYKQKTLNKLTGLMAAMIVAIFFTGCAETELASHVFKQTVNPASKSKGYFKVGSPYKIKGRKYYPKETYKHTEVGMASWYGPGFHGKMTANGEIFNKGDLTAAHRTLQMPSIIRVTNLRNGRSVVVRVNDRGPFAHERVLDLSESAASLLGFKNQGVTKIKIEVLPEESRMVAQAAKQGRDTRGVEVALNRHRAPVIKPSVPQQLQNPSLPNPSLTVPQHKTAQTQYYAAPQKFFIQAGAFSQEENAQRFSQLLAGLSDTNVISSLSPNGTLYKVRVGPVKTQYEANRLLAAVEQRSRSNAIIIKE